MQVLDGVVWEVLVCWGGSGAPMMVPGSSTKYETPSDRCALTAVTLFYHLAVGIPPRLILSRSFPVVI